MSNTLELANFVLTIGSEPRFELLDVLQELAIPAFAEGNSREYGKNTYSFEQMGRGTFTIDEIVSDCIYGRIVKDMTLQSEQKRGPDGDLISDNSSLETSPSSFFMLFLNNHRLAYIREHQFSPVLSEFETTFKNFLSQQYELYLHFLYLSDRASRGGENSKQEQELFRHRVYPTAIDGEWATARELLQRASDFTSEDDEESLSLPEGRLTKNWMRTNFLPRPIFKITPLPTPDTISEVISQYKMIKRLEISILPKNSEPDNSQILEGLRDRSKSLNGTETLLIDKASGDGASLSHPQVINQINEASGLGLNSIKLFGVDQAGDPLKGDQNTFTARHKIPSLERCSADDAANIAFTTTVDLIRKGLLKINFD